MDSKIEKLKSRWCEKESKLKEEIGKLKLIVKENKKENKEIIKELKSELSKTKKALRSQEKDTAYDIDCSRLAITCGDVVIKLLSVEAEERVKSKLANGWRLYNIVTSNGVYSTANDVAILKGNGKDFIQVFPDGSELRKDTLEIKEEDKQRAVTKQCKEVKLDLLLQIKKLGGLVERIRNHKQANEVAFLLPSLISIRDSLRTALAKLN